MAVKLAVLGADEPLAEVLFRELEERNLALAEVFALTLGEAEAAARFDGAEIPCQPAHGFDWKRIDLLVVATRGRAAGRFADEALAAGRSVPSGSTPNMPNSHRASFGLPRTRSPA